MNEYVSCRVASGQTRSEIIYEDAEVIGLMDICPIRPGHAQIIPREHFDYFEDLPDMIACRIIHLGQRLSRALTALYGVPSVAFLFSGGDHAHAHAHVVPMHEKTDLTSQRYIAEETLTFRNGARTLRGAGCHCRAAPQQARSMNQLVRIAASPALPRLVAAGERARTPRLLRADPDNGPCHSSRRGPSALTSGSLRNILVRELGCTRSAHEGISHPSPTSLSS